MKTILHGDHNENDGQIILRAGSLSMIYENGNLRQISNGKSEIIRMIYAAVRDREWLTIVPEISDEKIDLQHDSFTISYKCSYRCGDINFLAIFHIEGKSDNSLIFSLEGEALSTFEKNRIGICVLHPVKGYSGNNCTIVHSDATSEKCVFPDKISPHQPFLDITGMMWKIDGSSYNLIFSGEIFETEDQRNWTDGSYKTYCTPLTIPFPAKVNKGEKINQQVELKAQMVPAVIGSDSKNILISIEQESRTAISKIGIGRSTRPQPLTEPEINILKGLQFDHYRIDILLFKPDWKINALTALDEARNLNYPVEFALFFDDNAVSQVTAFTDWLSENNSNISVINLYHKDFKYTPDELTNTVAPAIRNEFPGINIASGTNSNFAQLNRNRPQSEHSNLICYSIHPQEHASDNLTLVENLESQKHTVESALNFSNGKGIWVSPVNIQRRFNANRENFESVRQHGEIPPQVDSRMMSLFGACWTTGSLKYLLESALKGVTFYETVGERGIIQGDFPSRWPENFKSYPGMIFPVFHVFRFILKYKSLNILRSTSDQPLKVDQLVLSDGSRFKIMLANLTAVQLEVSIPDVIGNYTLLRLYRESFAEATRDSNWLEKSPKIKLNSIKKLELYPFSVSFIE